MFKNHLDMDRIVHKKTGVTQQDRQHLQFVPTQWLLRVVQCVLALHDTMLWTDRM